MNPAGLFRTMVSGSCWMTAGALNHGGRRNDQANGNDHGREPAARECKLSSTGLFRFCAADQKTNDAKDGYANPQDACGHSKNQSDAVKQAEGGQRERNENQCLPNGCRDGIAADQHRLTGPPGRMARPESEEDPSSDRSDVLPTVRIQIRRVENIGQNVITIESHQGVCIEQQCGHARGQHHVDGVLTQ